MLRGMGLSAVSIGLPPLDAMLDGNGDLARGVHAGGFPLVFLTFFLPNGIWPKTFWPQQSGERWEPTPSLKPMDAWRGDILILKNLRKNEWGLNQEINNDAHIRGHATFATSQGITRTGVRGPSIDQVLAAKLGTKTKFQSLPVAIGRVNDPRLAVISWAAADTPVPAERSPDLLFARVFGDVGTGGRRLVKVRKSVLDTVRADASELTALVGAEDRARLDQHLTAIREVERQVETGPGRACRVPPPPEEADVDALSNERARLLLRLQVMALACDLTRFGSFQLAHRGDKRQFPWLGISNDPDGHHGISHQTSEQGREWQTKIVADELDQFAYLLKLLKEVKQGPRTMLDNALVFCANEVGEGLGHDVQNVPVILAGRAGGKLRPGRLVEYPRGTTYSNVFVSILNMFGLPETKFGVNGKAPLPELTA